MEPHKPPGFTDYDRPDQLDAAQYVINKHKLPAIPSAALPTVEDAQQEVFAAEGDLDNAEWQLEQLKRNKVPKTHLRMLQASTDVTIAQANLSIAKQRLAAAKAREVSERSTGKLEPRQPQQSAIFSSLKAGLKSRRRKHRNGSTRVFKHKTRHMSRRKNKA